jgi:hypothetical protein
MACDICLDLKRVWVKTASGMVIQPCPWCQPGPVGADPHLPALELARQIAADNPDAGDDQIAALIYDRVKRLRIIRDPGADNHGDA